MSNHSGFGSTVQEEIDPMADKLRQAKRDRQKTASIAGCSAEIQIIKQQMEHLVEQLNRTAGLIMTLQRRFDQYETNHAVQLSGILNGGPTVRN